MMRLQKVGFAGAEDRSQRTTALSTPVCRQAEKSKSYKTRFIKFIQLGLLDA